MAEDNKNYITAVPMLFGEEFAKQATTTVDQVKAMKKLTVTLENKRVFPDTTPEVFTVAVGVGPRSHIQRKPHRAAPTYPGQSSQEQRNN